MCTYRRFFFFFTAFFATYIAAESISSLKNFEGPWAIRNASANALPLIGKCPSMNVEPKDTGIDGVVMLRTRIKTFTMNLVTVDQETYQLRMPRDSQSDLIGNVSVIHADQRSFLITQLETVDQIYYAVLIKPEEMSPDTDQKIDSTWKSSKSAENVSLAPVEYEDCPEHVTVTEPYEYVIEIGLVEEPSETSIMSVTEKYVPCTKATPLDERKDTAEMENLSTAVPSESESEVVPLLSEVVPLLSEAVTLPIVSENGTTEEPSSANTFSSQSFTVAGVLFYLFVNYFCLE